MQLPIKPTFKRVRKDGTTNICIQYCYTSEKRILLDTGISIPAVYWSKSRSCIAKTLPPGYGDASRLNFEIRRIVRVVEEIVEFALKKGVSDPITFVRNSFHPNFQQSELQLKEQEMDAKNPRLNLDLFFQLDDYIAVKRNKVTPGMLNIYRNLKFHLAAFQEYRKKKITFDDFDFYDSLVDFLTYTYVQGGKMKDQHVLGLKTSTIGKTIKQLRIFLRDRMRRKIIPPIDLADFKVLDEESDAIYLNMQEITRLYEADLSKHSHLTDTRDLFVLGSLTGLRFSDFSNLRPEDVRNGMLYKKQGKSDHWVVIPLRETAKEILLTRFSKRIPPVYNSKFNAYIKEVGRLAGIEEQIKFSHKKGNRDVVVIRPKYGWICSHTCRRSFCTNEFLAGTPVELIMKISGHKSVKDFYKYIRITPEEAGQKISEIWQRRGEMGVNLVTLQPTI